MQLTKKIIQIWNQIFQFHIPNPEDESVFENQGPKKIEADDQDPDANKYKKKKSEKLSTWSALLVLAYLMLIFGFAIYMDSRLPEPLGYNDAAANPGRFIEERARGSLKRLTSVGARPAGSYENEVSSGLSSGFLF